MAELYVMHHSTCARKALFVMLEKGLSLDGSGPVRSREVERDFLRSPEYRQLNPDGLVPTLVADNGEVLTESSVIMRFLDEAYSGPRFQPVDPLQRAQMNLWMKLVDEKYFPALQAITVACFMRKMFGVPPDEQRLSTMLESLTDYGLRLMREDTIRKGVESRYVHEGLATVTSMLDRMEHSLQQREFVAGDQLSLADCALTPLVLRLEEFGVQGAWEQGRPKLTTWWARIKARPTVRQLLGLANQKLLHDLTGSVAEVRLQYQEALSAR